MSARVLARVGVVATLTFLGAIGAAQLWTAHAQSGYPNRPVTLVVPYPAGGTADLLCRFAADKASGNLGGQVVVENRPGGAGGRVGTEAVLRAPPDGYTLLCAALNSPSASRTSYFRKRRSIRARWSRSAYWPPIRSS